MMLRGKAATRVPSGEIHHPSIIPYNSDGSNIFRGVCAWHPGAQKNVLASTKHRLLFREPTSLKYISKLCRSGIWTNSLQPGPLFARTHARTCKHTHAHSRARTQVSDLSLTCYLGNLQKGGAEGGGTASCSKSIHQHLLESYLIKHVNTTYLFKVATGNSNKVGSEFSTITDNYLIAFALQVF